MIMKHTATPENGTQGYALDPKYTPPKPRRFSFRTAFHGLFLSAAGVALFINPAHGQTYWDGQTSNSWSDANWTLDITGVAANTLLGPNADVVFSSNSPANSANTTLGANQTISSLTINDSAVQSISGSTLTISGLLPSAITVGAGAGPVTISSNVALAGAANLITVNGGELTLSGVVSGTIGLTKDGDGVLTLTNTNTYTGDTAIADGTLQVGNGSTGSINVLSDVTIALGAVLQINLADAGSWGNDIVNNGQIQWISGGDNTQAGTSIISGTGSMLITSIGTTVLNGDNSLMLGGTTINTPGTVLAGTADAYGAGTLTIVNGTVDTFDNAILEISVGGYTQTGGETGFHLQGTTPANYTHYDVTGGANLGGGIVYLYQDDTGSYVPNGAWAGNPTGDIQTIIDTTTGVIGTFASDFPVATMYNQEFEQTFVYEQGETLLYPTLTYVNDVNVVWVRDPYTSIPGLTRNQRSVAGGLNGFAFLNPGTSGALAFLNAQPLASLPGLYDLIAPEEMTAIFQMGFHASEMQAASITQHLEFVRQGARRPMGDKESHTITASADGKHVEETAAVETPEGRWNIFVEGLGGNANVGSTSNAEGFDFTMYGAMMGADYLVNETLALGIMGGYAQSEASLINGGSIETDSFRAALYGTFFKGGFYLDGLVGLAYNSYDTDRLALLGRATGDTDGLEFTSMLNAGYDFRAGNLTFGPVASVAYTRVGIDGFNESGSLTPLSYRDQEQESLRTNLGAKISYVIPAGRVRITPQARVTWQHEFMDATQSIDSSFASGPGPVFTVDGPEMGRDSALVTAGVTVQFNPSVAAYAFYTGQLGRTNYDSHNVTVGVRISF
ncbi:outer membrane autotransporter protein [Prosthecobacter fusiformis]|uniref:Outer membrane autotransporter protein n=2 Tax=Prosthecobacter fusiformis TaxID=48464 RepID=A0A4R7RZF6_9BACT|nr:outer membrane autotransporter protein [Prosthecobacter fusiformis]